MPMTNDKEMCCSPTHGSGGQPQTAPIAMANVLNEGKYQITLTWCTDCQHRGEFLNWGKVHGWPALEIHPYALAEGAYYWQVTATMADESRMWTFLGLIEMLDKEADVA